MSFLLDSYRKNAAAALLEAEQAPLPKVRERAAEAASIWLTLAEKLEWVETQSSLKMSSAKQAVGAFSGLKEVSSACDPNY